jgi:hypothetical protein
LRGKKPFARIFVCDKVATIARYARDKPLIV